MILFLLNGNQFSFFFFFFVADHLQVGQIFTNPKSYRSLLSCLKVIQCSTSEIGDAPLYNSCTLPIQVMTTGSLPAPSKCKSGRFNAWEHSSMHRMTLRTSTVMLFCVLSSEGYINPKVTWMCWRVWWSPGQSGGRWLTLGVATGLVAGPQVQRDPGLASELVLQLWTLLSLTPSPPTWSSCTTSFGHTSRTSPTWPPTTPKLA